MGGGCGRLAPARAPPFGSSGPRAASAASQLQQESIHAARSGWGGCRSGCTDGHQLAGMPRTATIRCPSVRFTGLRLRQRLHPHRAFSAAAPDRRSSPPHAPDDPLTALPGPDDLLLSHLPPRERAWHKRHEERLRASGERLGFRSTAWLSLARRRGAAEMRGALESQLKHLIGPPTLMAGFSLAAIFQKVGVDEGAHLQLNLHLPSEQLCMASLGVGVLFGLSSVM